MPRVDNLDRFRAVAVARPCIVEIFSRGYAAHGFSVMEIFSRLLIVGKGQQLVLSECFSEGLDEFRI